MNRDFLIRISTSLGAAIDAIGRWVSWLALAHVGLVAINVILRYLFRIGPVALQELEWHLMSPIALIGISYAMCHQDHVRVDILYDKFSHTARHLIDLAAALVALIVSVIIIKLSLGYVEQAYAAGEVSPDPGGLPYRFLLKSFIPFGFLLLAIQALALVLREAAALMKEHAHG